MKISGPLERVSPSAARPSLVDGLGLALALAAGLVGCGGGVGPAERGVLRVSATQASPASAVVTAGFELADVTSYTIRALAGQRVVVDSTFVRVGPIQHDFLVEPNTYVVTVEAFQAGDVLLLSGLAPGAVAEDDTAEVAVELEAALGVVELTIAGGHAAQVPINATAPIVVTVRNTRSQLVAGARVELTVDPAIAGAITGPPETSLEGTLAATFDPAGGEVSGVIRAEVDGIPVEFSDPPRFSVIVPVDVNQSEVAVPVTSGIPADGVARAEVLVTVVDADGIPQPGIPIVIISSRNLAPGLGGQVDAIVSPQTETDAGGQFRAFVSSTSSSNLAGDALLTVTAGGKVLSDHPLLNFRSIVSAISTTIDVHPQTLPANGTSFADIVVQVRGLQGQPLAGTFVRLQTKNDTLFRLQPISGRTDAQGVFRSRISSTVRTGTIIDVFADGLKASDTGFVLFQ